MLDDDLQRLNSLPGCRSLNHLEADIWAGVETHERGNRMARLIYTCQAAVFVMGMIISAAAGTHTAPARTTSDVLNVLSAQADLSPASRLIGH